MNDRVIGVVVTPPEHGFNKYAECNCPMRHSGYNICQLLGQQCVTNDGGEFWALNKDCPLLSGDVIVRRQA